MCSAKISRIKKFANVGITAKSAKILLRENFPLYGIYVVHFAGYMGVYSIIMLSFGCI